MKEYTVIFDWAAESISSGDEPVLVLIQAANASDAMIKAQEKYLYHHPDDTEDDLYHVITFKGDVTGLVA